MMLDLARAQETLPEIPDWWPSWHGKTCVIVAGGPSSKDQPLHLLKGTRTKIIAINNAHELVPKAHVLFACDLSWWKRYGPDLKFKGLRLSTDKNACEPINNWGVQRVMLERPSDKLILTGYNRVGWGGNSGFQALNLAVLFGCTKIILVGYDMTTHNGLHWHGAHPPGMNNPSEANIIRWRKAVDAAADQIAPLGIQVINASKQSYLTRYPKMSFEKALKA